LSNPWKKKLVVQQVAPNSSAPQRLTIVRWKRLHGYIAIHAMSTWEKDTSVCCMSKMIYQVKGRMEQLDIKLGIALG